MEQKNGGVRGKGVTRWSRGGGRKKRKGAAKAEQPGKKKEKERKESGARDIKERGRGGGGWEDSIGTRRRCEEQANKAERGREGSPTAEEWLLRRGKRMTSACDIRISTRQ